MRWWLAGIVIVTALAAGAAAGCGARGAEPGVPGASSPQEWQRLADAPLSGRTGAVTVGVGDRAYVFGGWEFTCPPNADCSTPEAPLKTDGAVLDLSTGEWQPMADAPYGVRDAATTVLGEDIYIATRCRGESQCLEGPLELLRYDTLEDRWDELGTVPGGRDAYPSLQVVGDRVLALASTEEHGARADHLYDPAAEEWSELPDSPLPPAYDRSAVVDGDRLLVFGAPMVGLDEEQTTQIGAVLDLQDESWTLLPDAPGPGYQVWGTRDRAFLNPHYSGDGGGGVLDLDTDTWSAFPDGPDNAEGGTDLAGLISTDGAIYEYPDGWAFDARDDSFMEIPERPSTAYEESLTAVGRSLFVFGGQDWGDLEDPAGRGRLLADAWLWTPPPG